MINVALQTIKEFLLNWERLKSENIEDKSILEEKSTPHFVTILKNGEVIASSGTIKETEENLALEVIENTINAIKDPRFQKLSKDDLENLKVRVDKVISKTQIKPKESKIEDLNPVKNWVIAIKSDYKKIAVILPNISNQINTWNDLAEALAQKLGEKFDRNLYSIYSLETEQITNF